LEQEQTSTADQSSSPQSSSPRSPAAGWKNAPTRSSSSPSLREVATLHRISRYSPYPSALSPTRSLSPASSSSEFETSPLSPKFSFSSRRRPRKMRNKALHAIAYGSSSDLTADTPISTYVRRKTPGTSPTSPTFAPDSGYESSSPTAMPFSIPSLPDLLATSSSSETVPNSPSSDSEFEDHVRTSFRSRVKRFSKSNNGNCRTVRRPTGVRISVPPYPNNLRERLTDL